MPTLRVGLLTSWNTRCGIAEYSRGLAQALRRRGDVDLIVFGSRNVGDRAVRDYEEYARPVFDVQRWKPDHAFGLDVDHILSHELDVLHIQYSNLFYNRRRLVELMRRFPGLVALTYHDKVVSRAFPYGLADVLFAHREDVGRGPRRLIPQGMDIRRPVIKTFGLGKSRDDVIQEICDRRGWVFEKSYGNDRWLEHEELYQWLRDCDAIVLWYPEDLTSGGSAAAPMAISTRRPVFVNDTEWFRDLPNQTATLRKVHDLTQLELALEALFADPYAEQRSWDAVAEALVADYRVAFDLRDDDRSETASPGRRIQATLFALFDRKPLIKFAARFVPVEPVRRTVERVRHRIGSVRRLGNR